MSALLVPALSLEVLTTQDRGRAIDPLEHCRFCHCSEDAPCEIAVVEEVSGGFRLARNGEEAMLILACTWFVPGICSAPACMEKLQRELRGEAPVILFDAYGSRAG